MAKTTGPLLSFEAHGTIGNVLTYRQTKSKSTATSIKPKTTFKNTYAQQRVKIRFAALAHAWTANPSYHHFWDDLAIQDGISPYNAYLKFNRQLWNTPLIYRLRPQLIGTIPSAGSTIPTITTAPNYVKFAILNSTQTNAAWYCYYFGRTSAVTINNTNLMFIVPKSTTFAEISGIASGTWFYKRTCWSFDGGIFTAGSVASFVIP